MLNIVVGCRRGIFIASLLYIFAYLPLSATVYVPFWYKINVKTVKYLPVTKVNKAIDNLTSYFVHNKKLASKIWTKKERLHMQQVRGMYDSAFYIFIFCVLMILLLADKASFALAARAKTLLSVSVIIGVSASIMVSFFAPIWSWLHKIVFSGNSYYLYNLTDISYLLFPHSFFINSIIFIVVIFTLSLVALHLAMRFSNSHK
jgi:uncharacterized membrane protein